MNITCYKKPKDQKVNKKYPIRNEKLEEKSIKEKYFSKYVLLESYGMEKTLIEELLKKHNGDLKKIFNAYYDLKQKNEDSIITEVNEKTNEVFNKKKRSF